MSDFDQRTTNSVTKFSASENPRRVTPSTSSSMSSLLKTTSMTSSAPTSGFQRKRDGNSRGEVKTFLGGSGGSDVVSAASASAPAIVTSAAGGGGAGAGIALATSVDILNQPPMPDLPMWINHPDATNLIAADICRRRRRGSPVDDVVGGSNNNNKDGVKNCSIILQDITYNTSYAFRVLVNRDVGGVLHSGTPSPLLKYKTPSCTPPKLQVLYIFLVFIHILYIFLVYISCRLHISQILSRRKKSFVL